MRNLEISKIIQHTADILKENNDPKLGEQLTKELIKKLTEITYFGDPAHIKTLEELKTEFGDNAAVYTKEEFISECNDNMITSYDGHGYFHDGERETIISVWDNTLSAEDVEPYPYVIWYNK